MPPPPCSHWRSIYGAVFFPGFAVSNRDRIRLLESNAG
jgi:hypothetical protein